MWLEQASIRPDRIRACRAAGPSARSAYRWPLFALAACQWRSPESSCKISMPSTKSTKAGQLLLLWIMMRRRKEATKKIAATTTTTTSATETTLEPLQRDGALQFGRYKSRSRYAVGHNFALAACVLFSMNDSGSESIALALCNPPLALLLLAGWRVADNVYFSLPSSDATYPTYALKAHTFATNTAKLRALLFLENFISNPH